MNLTTNLLKFHYFALMYDNFPQKKRCVPCCLEKIGINAYKILPVL